MYIDEINFPNEIIEAIRNNNLVVFAGAGASVPLLGFGNVLWKGIKEAIDENGLIGLFMGGFTACAVGVSAALIFSYLASLIFKPKMKG